MDLVVAAGVLVSELIAREPENGEFAGVFLLDGLVQFLKTCELGREAAFGGSIDDEDDFAFVLVQGVGVSLL